MLWLTTDEDELQTVALEMTKYTNREEEEELQLNTRSYFNRTNYKPGTNPYKIFNRENRLCLLYKNPMDECQQNHPKNA